MPSRTTTRSRRRNPDPPETLEEYFEEQVAGARKDLETRIPHVSFDDFSGKWEYVPKWGLRDLRLNRIPSRARGTLYLISATIGLAASSNTVAGTARALVRVSDKLRLPVLLHAHRDVELPRFVRIYDEEGFLPVHLHLPSGIPREFERRVYEQVLANGSVYELLDALETLARYHFLVPEEYREQIGMLAQQAFEDDDLAAYLQARELAALVSESSPTARKNPPPKYVPASARRERAEADAATLEHHKAFLARVRALKEKYGSSWQFPELAGLTPVAYEYVPTSLGEHLLADYVQAVAQEGVSVAYPQRPGQAEYGLDFPDGSSAVVRPDVRATVGVLAVTKFAGNNPRVAAEVLARAAERTGRLVSVEDASLAKAMSALKHKRVGVPSLYVSAHVKGKREIADAYFALRVDPQDADALYTLAKAVREALFPRVPKEYKPKFARFVSQAFGDEALGFLNATGAGTSSPDQVGAYQQARDLAELVSE